MELLALAGSDIVALNECLRYARSIASSIVPTSFFYSYLLPYYCSRHMASRASFPTTLRSTASILLCRGNSILCRPVGCARICFPPPPLSAAAAYRRRGGMRPIFSRHNWRGNIVTWTSNGPRQDPADSLRIDRNEVLPSLSLL